MPMAGKVDVCLFDKTGTLTTDELVAVGVERPVPVPIPSANAGTEGTGQGDRSSPMDTLVPMLDAPPAATLVLAGCQSLVLMEGSEAGDPVEAASMKSIKVSRLAKFTMKACTVCRLDYCLFEFSMIFRALCQLRQGLLDRCVVLSPGRVWSSCLHVFIESPKRSEVLLGSSFSVSFHVFCLVYESFSSREFETSA